MIKGGTAMVYVSDLNRSIDFFENTIGLRLLVKAPEHYALLRASNGFLLGLHPAGQNSPSPGNNGATIVGFSIDSNMDDAISRLTQERVDVDQKSRSEDGRVETVGFRDPDGNQMFLVREFSNK